MTKKIKLITITLITMMATLNAQLDWQDINTGTRYPGYVIYKDASDTVKGWIENMGPTGNQEKAVFFGSQNDKKPVAKYTPENVKSYGFKDKHYRSMHYSGGLFEKPLRFLLLVKEGGIATYKWYADKQEDVYAKVNDPSTLPHTQDYFLLKFKTKMADFVADFAELSKKIGNGEKGYGIMKLFDIFEEYNKWYLNEKK